MRARWNIIPFRLPSHTTHLLQPLDVVVFQPFKHYHAEAVEQATQSGCSDFNKVEFLHALHSIREQTFNKNIILSAFRETGLLPFDPEIVLERLRELEAPTRLTTPSPSPSSPHTPLTIWSLKRQANSLEEIAADLSPTIQRKLGGFVSGSLAQVQLGARALAHTQAAQKARATRQQAGRHTLQGRGQCT